MDWLNSTTEFTRHDTNAFSFLNYHSFEIVAVKIQWTDQVSKLLFIPENLCLVDVAYAQRSPQGDLTFEKEILLSQNEYTQWIERV